MEEADTAREYVDNLEWLENNQYTKRYRAHTVRGVIQVSSEDGFLREYSTLAEFNAFCDGLHQGAYSEKGEKKR